MATQRDVIARYGNWYRGDDDLFTHCLILRSGQCQLLGQGLRPVTLRSFKAPVAIQKVNCGAQDYSCLMGHGELRRVQFHHGCRIRYCHRDRCLRREGRWCLARGWRLFRSTARFGCGETSQGDFGDRRLISDSFLGEQRIRRRGAVARTRGIARTTTSDIGS
jgi:hypothetical protein